MATVKIVASGKDFGKALGYIKSIGGVFSGGTWTLTEAAYQKILPGKFGVSDYYRTVSAPGICSVCGGKVNYSERYARPGYCGCEGE